MTTEELAKRLDAMRRKTNAILHMFDMAGANKHTLKAVATACEEAAARLRELEGENARLRAALAAAVDFMQCGPCTTEVDRFMADEQGVEIAALLAATSKPSEAV